MSSSTESTSSSTARTELQVRTLMGEIANLSKRDVTPEEFHAEFLRWVTAALGAVGGGLWILENGTLSLAYQINFKELRLQEGDTEKHSRLLTQLLNSPDTGTVLPPHSGSEGDNEAGNPTEHLLIFCPIRTELEIVGLVEIIHRPDAPVAIQKNFVQFLAQTCKYATDYYKNRQLRHFGERQNLWVVLEDFTRTIHQNLDPRLTAYTVANEGRRLIGCDRVSVALRSGKSCPVMAVSGQDTVNKRGTLIRLLGKVAGVVLKAGEQMWYSGSTADFPPQIETAVEKYVDEAHSKMIAVIPLTHRGKINEGEIEEKKRRPKPKKPFGVLIVEQLSDNHITEQLRKRVDIVAEHASSALGNALEHKSIFLLPLWKLIGKSKQLIAGETLPKTIAISAAIILVLGSMFFLPWQFQMHCTGTLEPIIRHRIFSTIDAEILHLFVDHGARVRGPLFKRNCGCDDDNDCADDCAVSCDVKYVLCGDGNRIMTHRGTTLLQLRSPDLEAREIQLRGDELEILKRIASIDRQLLDQQGRLSDFERAELVGQRDRAYIQLDTVRRQLDIFLRYQKPELFITAPRDGVVVSWDVQRLLMPGKPIGRLHYVMEIADVDGPWQLELLMPERRMGYIMKQYKQNPNLRVEFIVATQPGTTHYGTVVEISDRAQVRTDSGSASAMSSNINTVLIRVALDNKDALPLALRPGAEVSARVDCGKRPLGYVLFYELIVYFQKNILFRWF